MREAIIGIGLGYGDEGKGTIIDFLTKTRKAHTVVRFNGGAQAAHNVVTPERRHHTFHLFGSGSFHGAATALSRHVIVDPFALLVEEQKLHDLGVHDAFQRLYIDSRCDIITPYHRAAGRLRSKANGHGSCGLGIGEFMRHKLGGGTTITAAELVGLNARKVAEKLEAIRLELAKESLSPTLQDEAELLQDGSSAIYWADQYADFVDQAGFCIHKHPLDRILARDGTVLFEGTQGVLLDEWYGFHPHTTWSSCTFDNALDVLAEYGYRGEVTKLGITRAYASRHGNGPFVTEEPNLRRQYVDHFNTRNEWQRDFRVGHLDFVMLKYAIQAVRGVDLLAVTCMDQLGLKCNPVCRYYRGPGDDVWFDGCNLPFKREHDLVFQERLKYLLTRCSPLMGPAIQSSDLRSHIEDVLGVQIGIMSYGVTHLDKEMRPDWLRGPVRSAQTIEA